VVSKRLDPLPDGDHIVPLLPPRFEFALLLLQPPCFEFALLLLQPPHFEFALLLLQPPRCRCQCPSRRWEPVDLRKRMLDELSSWISTDAAATSTATWAAGTAGFKPATTASSSPAAAAAAATGLP
jgi:hypothetical protein